MQYPPVFNWHGGTDYHNSNVYALWQNIQKSAAMFIHSYCRMMHHSIIYSYFAIPSAKLQLKVKVRMQTSLSISKSDLTKGHVCFFGSANVWVLLLAKLQSDSGSSSENIFPNEFAWKGLPHRRWQWPKFPFTQTSSEALPACLLRSFANTSGSLLVHGCKPDTTSGFQVPICLTLYNSIEKNTLALV